MSGSVQPLWGRRFLIIAGFLMIGLFGYTAGYHMRSGGDNSEGKAPVAEQEQVKSLTTTATATTTLPGNRVNAFTQENPRLPGIDGQEHSLDEWKGKVIMLNFWATWCPPCQYEIPGFIRFQEEYGDLGLQIVGVGIDEMRKLKNYSRTLEMNYPILASKPEQSEKLLRDWGNDVQILPYTVVIDRDGRIAYIQRGEFTQTTFEEFVQPLLTKQALN